MTCCYTDANGSSCHCQRRKDVETENTRLSARMTELEVDRAEAISTMLEARSEGIAEAFTWQTRACAAEAALATARADALREALEAIDAIPEAGSADFNMGVSRAYVTILDLIPQEKPHE